jgi:hypothetical protein
MKAAAADEVGHERRDRVGFVVSLGFHALAIAYIISILPGPVQPDEKAPEQVITITQRPRPTPPPTPQPTPRPTIEPAATALPTPAPLVANRQPVTPARPHAPEPRPQHHVTARPAPAKLAFIPHHIAPPPELHSQRVTQLSSAHLAQIDRDLGQAIAADRQGENALAGTATQPDYAKHYAADVGSFTTGALRHGGLCDPIKSWEADGYDYYFVSCNVRFGDGTYERQPVPWPVRFKPDRDPFNGTLGHEEPLALPLPGWTLPAGETISKELRQYALDRGVQLPE